MKKTCKRMISLFLAVLLLTALTACRQKSKGGLWDTAVYQQDQTFGSGSTTIEVEVQAEEKSVTFTLRTDKETVGEALLEHGLIAGEKSEYGLYVKTVNGMLADYDVDQSYWAFCQNGEYLMTGVDSTAVSEGTHFELVYTK